VGQAELAGFTPHPAIPLPRDLYAPERRNSAGLDFSDAGVLADTLQGMQAQWRRPPGEVCEPGPAEVGRAVDIAHAAQEAWNARGFAARAAILERLADLLETRRVPLMALAVQEGRKTLGDALGEVREAVDFCRYYAVQARAHAAPLRLPGPTGEINELSLAGRGVIACVSPWNFPLAIFLGQVTAALAAGNAVVAKPAPQTPRIAAAAVALAHEAGVPSEVLALVAGGAETGAALVAHPRIMGVAFTGSTASARRIAHTLLEDETRPLVPLIAETGGVNAMLVDSTALPEQVTADVVTSAFLSAGQRCSALRLLCLHEDIAEATLEMLAGAMDELVVGDPADPATDIGPVIDAEAKTRIDAHVERWRGRVVHQTPMPAGLPGGTFVAPTLIRLDRVADLDREVFGPVLHVVTFASGRLEATLEEINASGFGLTMGLHSRIGSAAEAVRARARVGNLYVNRSMIGAVVGVQPFGGEGLSGTGPKAGGPHYLPRFCVERTWTVDTTSAGGNASLLSLEG
jgi:RHH-type proline utilization regulon transcriptional repressor/proline dehydrogenase/delta 1-pyrroline-5-carboxylate dehydrogenase